MTWARTAANLTAHATSDGNTTTEVVGSALRTKLWGDDWGTVIDPNMWQHYAAGPDIGFTPTAGGSTVENGNLVITVPTGQSAQGRALEAKKSFAAGVAIDVHVKVSYAVGDITLGFHAGIVIWDGAGQDFVRIGWFRDGASLRIQAQKVVNGGATTIGTVVTADADVTLRITRTTANVWEFLYDLAGGVATTSLGTTTEDYGSAMKLCIYASSNNDSQSVTLTCTQFKQDAGGIYWPDQTVEFDHQAFGGTATIQFSAFLVTAGSGALKFDHSENGGAVYSGTLRTAAQVVGLGNLEGTGIRWKFELNGGGVTALASLDGLQVDTTTVLAQAPITGTLKADREVSSGALQATREVSKTFLAQAA